MSEHGDKTHCYSQFQSKGAVVVGVTHVTCARARVSGRFPLLNPMKRLSLSVSSRKRHAAHRKVPVVFTRLAENVYMENNPAKIEEKLRDR